MKPQFVFVLALNLVATARAIAASPAAPPTLVSPPNNATYNPGSSRLQFQWTTVNNATSYTLCRSLRMERSNVACAAADAVIVRGLSEPRLTPELPAAFQRQDYIWAVAACNTEGCSGFSNPSIVRFRTTLDPPILVSPSDRFQTEGRTERFSWYAVDGAVNYKLCFSRTGEACRQSGAVIFDRLPDPTATVSGLDRYAGSGNTLNWAVAACFAGGCTDSATRTLTVGALTMPVIGHSFKRAEAIVLNSGNPSLGALTVPPGEYIVVAKANFSISNRVSFIAFDCSLSFAGEEDRNIVWVGGQLGDVRKSVGTWLIHARVATGQNAALTCRPCGLPATARCEASAVRMTAIRVGP